MNSNSITTNSGTSDRWLMLALVSLDYFTLYVHRKVINFIQPALIEDLGVSDLQIGFLDFAFLVPYCAAQIWVGYLGDRFTRRRVLLISLVASSVALACMGLANSFAVLFTLRVLLALGQSCSVPAISSTIADCFTPRTRSRAMGIYLISYTVALVLTGWIGGVLADSEPRRIPLGLIGLEPLVFTPNWRTAMYLFGGLGVFNTLILLIMFREPKRTEREATVGLGTQGANLWPTLKAVCRVRTYLMIALVFTVLGTVWATIRYWLARYLYDIDLYAWHHADVIRFDQGQAGLFATVWDQIGTVVGLFLGGWLADWLARRSISGRTNVQIFGVLACIPALWFIGTSHSLEVLSLSLLIFGIGIGLYQANLWTAAFEVVDPAARATAVGLLNVVSGLLTCWVNPLIGSINDAAIEHYGQGTLDVVFLSLTMVAGLAMVLLMVNRRFLLPHDYRGPLRPSTTTGTG